MIPGTTPKWLIRLERTLGWIAIPNIAVIIVTLQVLGFAMVSLDPAWYLRLILVPDAVREGEFWRVITFLAIPLSTSLLWFVFAAMFLWFVLNTIEREWGAFRTTFYVLVSLVLTVAFSFAFGFPVTQVRHFESTLFLAAAALYPEYEILVFGIMPVKMKWLAALTVIFLGVEVVQSGWLERLYLLAIYSNYLLFFGPSHLSQIKYFLRRVKYRGKLRG